MHTLASSSPTFKVRKSGLWIDTSKGWLACSPDGVIEEDGALVGVLEIKCPYSARDMSPIEACDKLPTFSCQLIDRQLTLKRTHNYYFQVQGQLAITGAKWCDFFVYTSCGFEIERIYPDPSLWDDVLQVLDNFFSSHCVPLVKNVSSVEQLLYQN